MLVVRMHNNIIKCNRCGEFISSELSDSHTCTIPLKDVKEIFIDYFFETKTANKDTIIIAKGLDGTLYRLIVSKTKTFTNYPTDFDRKNNRHRLDRTQGKYCGHSRGKRGSGRAEVGKGDDTEERQKY